MSTKSRQKQSIHPFKATSLECSISALDALENGHDINETTTPEQGHLQRTILENVVLHSLYQLPCPMVIQGLPGAGKSHIIKSVIREFVSLGFCEESQVFSIAYNNKVTSYLRELLSSEKPMTYFCFTGLPILKLSIVRGDVPVASTSSYSSNTRRNAKPPPAPPSHDQQNGLLGAFDEGDDDDMIAMVDAVEQKEEQAAREGQDQDTKHIIDSKLNNPPSMHPYLIRKMSIAMAKNLMNAKLIVVDEYPTLSATEFINLDMQLRFIRNKPNTLFGGVPILMFGDHNQLGAVVDDSMEGEWPCNVFEEYICPNFLEVARGSHNTYCTIIKEAEGLTKLKDKEKVAKGREILNNRPLIAHQRCVTSSHQNILYKCPKKKEELRNIGSFQANFVKNVVGRVDNQSDYAGKRPTIHNTWLKPSCLEMYKKRQIQQTVGSYMAFNDAIFDTRLNVFEANCDELARQHGTNRNKFNDLSRYVARFAMNAIKTVYESRAEKFVIDSRPGIPVEQLPENCEDQFSVILAEGAMLRAVQNPEVSTKQSDELLEVMYRYLFLHTKGGVIVDNFIDKTLGGYGAVMEEIEKLKLDEDDDKEEAKSFTEYVQEVLEKFTKVKGVWIKNGLSVMDDTDECYIQHSHGHHVSSTKKRKQDATKGAIERALAQYFETEMENLKEAQKYGSSNKRRKHVAVVEPFEKNTANVEEEEEEEEEDDDDDYISSNYVGIDPGLSYFTRKGDRVIVKPKTKKSSRMEVDDEEFEFVKISNRGGASSSSSFGGSSGANDDEEGRFGFEEKRCFKNQLTVGEWNNRKAFSEAVCVSKYRFYQLLRTLFRTYLGVANVCESTVLPMFDMFNSQKYSTTRGFSTYFNYVREQTQFLNLRSLKRIQPNNSHLSLDFLAGLVALTTNTKKYCVKNNTIHANFVKLFFSRIFTDICKNRIASLCDGLLDKCYRLCSAELMEQAIIYSTSTLRGQAPSEEEKVAFFHFFKADIDAIISSSKSGIQEDLRNFFNGQKVEGLGDGSKLTNDEKAKIRQSMLANAHQPPPVSVSTRKLLARTNQNMSSMMYNYNMFLDAVGGLVCKRQKDGSDVVSLISHPGEQDHPKKQQKKQSLLRAMDKKNRARDLKRMKASLVKALGENSQSLVLETAKEEEEDDIQPQPQQQVDAAPPPPPPPTTTSEPEKIPDDKFIDKGILDYLIEFEKAEKTKKKVVVAKQRKAPKPSKSSSSSSNNTEAASTTASTSSSSSTSTSSSDNDSMEENGFNKLPSYTANVLLLISLKQGYTTNVYQDLVVKKKIDRQHIGNYISIIRIMYNFQDKNMLESRYRKEFSCIASKVLNPTGSGWGNSATTSNTNSTRELYKNIYSFKSLMSRVCGEHFKGATLSLKPHQSVCFYKTTLYQDHKVQAKEEGVVEAIYVKKGTTTLDGLVVKVYVPRLKSAVYVNAVKVEFGPMVMLYINLIDSSASTVHSCQGMTFKKGSLVVSFEDINKHTNISTKAKSLYVILTRPTSPEWLRILTSNPKVVDSMMTEMIQNLQPDDGFKKRLKSLPYHERNSVYKIIDEFLVGVSPSHQDDLDGEWLNALRNMTPEKRNEFQSRMDEVLFTDASQHKSMCEKAMLKKMLELCYVCYLACINFSCNQVLTKTGKDSLESMMKRDYSNPKNEDKTYDKQPCLNCRPFSFEEFCEIAWMIFPESESFSIALFYLNVLARRYELFNLLGVSFSHKQSSHTYLNRSRATKLDWSDNKNPLMDNICCDFNIDQALNFSKDCSEDDNEKEEEFASLGCQHGTINVVVSSCPTSKQGNAASPTQASVFCTPKNRVISYEGNLFALLCFGMRLTSAQHAEIVDFKLGEMDPADNRFGHHRHFRISDNFILRRNAGYKNQAEMFFTIGVHISKNVKNIDAYHTKMKTNAQLFCEKAFEAVNDTYKKFSLCYWTYSNVPTFITNLGNIQQQTELMFNNNVGNYSHMTLPSSEKKQLASKESIQAELCAAITQLIDWGHIQNRLCAFKVRLSSI